MGRKINKHRRPRTTTRITRRYIVGNGTPEAFETDCLRVTYGGRLCPDTTGGRHVIGSRADTCDSCYVVKGGE
jgi:hypothetical protein